ncbi:26S proteasome non-ATPase regulatory subunit 9 [Mortierella alpina]|uniref:Probable 26S proteasome regulatory subunit p27 n=1 Tax=Mortierella alpina TaxID=64518 RepID=A0A9P6JAY6_MORAP|nr:26S proteasome non-ATPase regulatory subunit 9 [Mortierella alpina]
MVNTQSDLMTRAQTLMKQKDDIEADIKKAQDELQSQKVGMTERLIDNNGFPRSDIDLVVVTTARSNIIRLKNDHKEIMLQIEEALHAVHAEAIAEKEAEKNAHNQESSGTSAAGSFAAAQQEADKDLSPFARVNGVAPDSPAKDAGLLQGDMIVAFGTVNAKTPSVLPSLSEHVQSRENKPILVKVLRGESADLHSLILVPKQGWGGRGLLGCHIVPV